MSVTFIPSLRSKPTVFAHPGIERSQGVDLTRRAGEGVGCLEVFVAASAPEPALRVNDERMPDATPEDRGTVGTDIARAGPRPLLRMLRHVFFNTQNKTRKETCAVGRWSLEDLSDGLAKHAVGRRRWHTGLKRLRLAGLHEPPVFRLLLIGRYHHIDAPGAQRFAAYRRARKVIAIGTPVARPAFGKATESAFDRDHSQVRSRHPRCSKLRLKVRCGVKPGLSPSSMCQRRIDKSDPRLLDSEKIALARYEPCSAGCK
jgi:hypothetical protein